MGFYSFIVMAPGEVVIPEQLIYLEAGQNVFNAAIDDIGAFLKRLADDDVEIIQMNQLDNYEMADEPLDIDLEQDPFDDEPPALSRPR